MNWIIQTAASPAYQRFQGHVVFGMNAEGMIHPKEGSFPKEAQQHINKVLKHQQQEGGVGSYLWLHQVPGMVGSVLLLGLGNTENRETEHYVTIVDTLQQALKPFKTAQVLWALPTNIAKNRDANWHIHTLVLRCLQAALPTKPNLSQKTAPNKKKTAAKTLVLVGNASVLHQPIHQATAIHEGMALARELVNLPANIATPRYLAERAQGLAKIHRGKIKTQVLDEKAMKKLGMGSFLSVGHGSAEPPRLAMVHYQGGKKGEKPVVLVGKGITFDSGGISIKPAAGMEDMKFDMAGAASVLGTLHTISLLKLPISVIGMICASENMPSGTATRPGDIVTSYSGQTIEINNTDAEGRLVLCDAISYAQDYFNPACIIDIATLTGAVLVALGHEITGLFSNEEALAEQLLAAADTADEPTWRLPLWKPYQKKLDSPFADVQNSNHGYRYAGTIIAACFLQRFVKPSVPWAHLDVAGTATFSGRMGGSGRPVPLLTAFLMACAEKKSLGVRKKSR